MESGKVTKFLQELAFSLNFFVAPVARLVLLCTAAWALYYAGSILQRVDMVLNYYVGPVSASRSLPAQPLQQQTYEERTTQD